MTYRKILFIITAVLMFTACGNNETVTPTPAQLNFDPGKYENSLENSGKTVLLEVFTGAECPPCAAVDLAIEGLMQVFDRSQLAVIAFHLPIPGPDPMMSRASHFRAFHYDAHRVPMTFFDGEEKFRGGGPPEKAEEMFKLYFDETGRRLAEKPEVNLNFSATMSGEAITVTGETDNFSADYELHYVLVQKKIEYLGRNRITVHKMVARQHKTGTNAGSGSHSIQFEIAEVQEELSKWLDNVEKNYAPYKFRERRDSVDVNQLAVVTFIQDKTSGRILNAAVADVN